MKMKRGLLASLFVVLAVVAHAHAQQPLSVKVDFDQSYDFTKIKTFATQVASPWNDPFAEKRVQDQVDEVLAAKGWAKADPADADVTVMLHGATEARKQLNAMYSGGGWRFGGLGTGTLTETEFTVGTLVVDIFGSKSKQLLFRGTAQDTVSDKSDANAKRLTKALAKMFKDFPPGEATKKK